MSNVLANASTFPYLKGKNTSDEHTRSSPPFSQARKLVCRARDSVGGSVRGLRLPRERLIGIQSSLVNQPRAKQPHILSPTLLLGGLSGPSRHHRAHTCFCSLSVFHVLPHGFDFYDVFCPFSLWYFEPVLLTIAIVFVALVRIVEDV